MEDDLRSSRRRDRPRRHLPLLIAAALSAPVAASADPGDAVGDAQAWRFDFGFGVVVPVGLQKYEDATSFGGRVLARASHGRLATQVDVDVLARDNGPALEQLGYRFRGLAGVRFRHEPDFGRAIELRIMGGVELGGMDRIQSDWLADRYAVGAAAEIGIENRNELGWGTVALYFGLGVGVQPFGDEDQDQTNYVGIDVLFAAIVTR